MHIPDGFISPLIYLPAYAASGMLWYLASKKVSLESETLPFLATLSALSFVFMMIAIPLPGGTSFHLSGIALLAVIFAPWLSFLAASLVLVVEAFLFGEGGITTLGVNILAIAFIGSFSAYLIFRLLKNRSETLALFAAGWLSVNLSALFIAVILGLQPLIASEGSKALFFPFDIKTTTLAVMIPHLIIGVAEGIVTVALYRFLKKNFKVIFNA